MRIQYASDLHLEFKANTLYLQENPLPVIGDILVLAGDIILFEKNSLVQHPFFDWCADNFLETCIIPGNHEYYNGTELSDTLSGFEYFLRPNVRYLNNKSIIAGQTELFFTTLWSVIDIMQLMPVQTGVADCHRIIYDNRRFTSQDYEVVHQHCLAWLKESLSQSLVKRKIIVTHHCPTDRFRDPRFIESTINSAFVVRMDDFVERSLADYWIFGHTHYNGGKALIGKTQLLCNQLGYVHHGEHHSFKADAFFEV
ncbi:MAG: metallophosphoesterase [Prevotella sp.]|jgi:DNA repair exonuclease SbcCD nuclease subunit|nr:metallophosphoesterase [Prevotella sp.]